MSVTSIRLDEKTRSEAEKFAQKNGLSLSEYLRTIIEKSIVTEKYHEQNSQPLGTQPNKNQSANNSEAKFLKALEFINIETAILLRLIIKESGKFTTAEAERLRLSAHEKTEKFLGLYGKL